MLDHLKLWAAREIVEGVVAILAMILVLGGLYVVEERGRARKERDREP